MKHQFPGNWGGGFFGCCEKDGLSEILSILRKKAAIIPARASVTICENKCVNKVGSPWNKKSHEKWMGKFGRWAGRQKRDKWVEQEKS